MKFKTEMLNAYLVGGSQDTESDPVKLLERVEIALKNGITMFQYREKGTGALQGLARQKLGHRLHNLCQRYHCPFVVDDDLVLALTLKADGIHVGQGDQAIRQVTKVAQQAGMFVGYSCNTKAEILQANQLTGIDYYGIGPIFPTQSKVDADPVLGLQKLIELNQLAKKPIVAIGGISSNQLATVRQTGVAGIAVISQVLGSDDVALASRQLVGEKGLKN
ncbi:thiamine phosphate synthase [Lactobacillus sp. 3B(2020)]|uniref:thiamine phosphate synthase n=1 Tax=Lactobacillus sp. 3B(2020) TaxID=2695882 RepID=UPI0015DF7DEE|nr:thiamine phosphate synthase [Lactobacillus sp. 3B(2020)]QLL69923.1 thiamine phosphate synthase [Lactobacillus sp. 3B(2020)]